MVPTNYMMMWYVAVPHRGQSAWFMALALPSKGISIPEQIYTHYWRKKSKYMPQSWSISRITFIHKGQY